MNEPDHSDNGPATNVSPTLRIEKAAVLSLSIVGLVTLTYIAWYLLPMLLWPWTQQIWWHWAPAVLAFLFLFSGPLLVVMGIISIMKERTRTKNMFWWTAVNFLVLVVLALVILWAFLPSGSWWRSGYWWIWGVLVIVLAILAPGARMFRAVQQVETRRERDSYAHEWRFNHGDINAPPILGLAMSGGGIRSAAFNLGILQALHEGNILRSVDVMSAVSGGTYIMSWYLLQPFYAAKSALQDTGNFEISKIIEEMFDTQGRFQAYLSHRPEVIQVINTGIGAVLGATLEQPLRAFVSFGDDLDQFNSGGVTRRNYREGIQKLFHGHPRKDFTQKIENAIDFSWNQNQAVTEFTRVTPVTYQELAKFALDNHLPFFIFNGAALVNRPFRNMLWPTVFELTADDLGSDVSGYRRWEDLLQFEAEELSQSRRQTKRQSRLFRVLESKQKREQPGRWVHLVNLAPAISGAAIGLARHDPKKKPRTMKLSTWMPFVGNVDLGFLFPRKILNSESALYVSDGGHSENLGAYALIRRRCNTIVVVDAEYEHAVPYVFNGYSKLKHQLKEEQSLMLTVDAIDTYLAKNSVGLPPAVMTGKVTPTGDLKPGEQCSSVLYIKLVLDKKCPDSLPAEVIAYAEKNDSFPQDPTTNQSFTSEQFSAYRELGRHFGAVAVARVRDLL